MVNMALPYYRTVKRGYFACRGNFAYMYRKKLGEILSMVYVVCLQLN